MEPIERKIRIAAPADHCWRVFTDIDRLPERLEHVVAVTRLSGPQFDVGTRWRHTTRPPQQAQRSAVGLGQNVGGAIDRPAPQQPAQVSAEVEVIGCDPGRFYTLAIKTAIGRSVYAYEFTQIAPNMTELRAIAQMQPTSLRSRFTIFALRRVLTRAIEGAFDHLLGQMQRLTERLHQANETP